MFDPVLDWFGRALISMLDFFRTSFGKIVGILVAPLLGFFGLILHLVAMVEARFSAMIDTATDAFGSATSLSAGTSFGVANFFVPLDLMFEYCALLFGLWLVSLVYRAIKSFIPTLS